MRYSLVNLYSNIFYILTHTLLNYWANMQNSTEKMRYKSLNKLLSLIFYIFPPTLNTPFHNDIKLCKSIFINFEFQNIYKYLLFSKMYYLKNIWISINVFIFVQKIIIAPIVLFPWFCAEKMHKNCSKKCKVCTKK